LFYHYFFAGSVIAEDAKATAWLIVYTSTTSEVGFMRT